MRTPDLPVKVFEGEPSEIAFLKSLLEAAGIETNVTGRFFGPAYTVYVKRSDETAAREVLSDFEKNGRRSNVYRQPGDVLRRPE